MDVSPAKKSYFTCVNVWWKLLFHSTFSTRQSRDGGEEIIATAVEVLKPEVKGV